MRNLVRAYRYGLGQDIPDIYDPGLQTAIDTTPPATGDQYLYYGPISPTAAAAQGYPTMNAPTSTPATPTSSPTFQLNLPATTTPPTLAPGPAPRVAVPITGLSSIFSGSSSWLLIAAGAAALLLLAAPGGRRRR
jgi:hypothetical protein